MLKGHLPRSIYHRVYSDIRKVERFYMDTTGTLEVSKSTVDRSYRNSSTTPPRFNLFAVLHRFLSRSARGLEQFLTFRGSNCLFLYQQSFSGHVAKWNLFRDKTK